MATKRRLERRATAAEWTAANPVLGPAEIGVETDTLLFKLGDGTTAWTALDYVGGGGAGGDHPDTDHAGLIPTSEKGAANGVATLGADSKIPSAQIPAIALSEFLGSVASQAAMLALTGQRGDWAVRTDTDPDSVWILESDDPTQVANWTNVTGPGAVISVDGRTGAVTLTDLYAGTAHTHAAVTIDFSANVNIARPVTTSPVIWIGGSATPTNVDYTKGDIVIDATNGNVTLDGGTPSTPGDVLQIRRGTAAQWSSANPTPPAGVFCFETDTRVLKVGDGSTAYNSLPAVNGGGGGTLTVQEDGTTVATGVTQLDIIGAGATAAAGTGEVTITIPGGGGGSIAVEEEGVEVVAAATRLDIVGAGATVTDTGSGQATITIPGGGTAPLFDRRTTDHAGRSLSTTLTDDDQVGPIPLEANQVYELTGVMVYDGHDGGDIKFQLNGPAGAELNGSFHRLSDVATSVTGSIVTNSIVLGSSRAAGAITGVPVTAQMRGLLSTAGTAGDLTLQWAQNTSHATATRLLKGTFLLLRKLT